ncbi:MAG: nucleotidyl transferase AbiEii/AbiGii toxin family protein, partial [Blastocatellia bacterium]|nr:nucleotidyl transferase AbiEii/AbiGii toxin family protein [Blastocatellia bacterium]
TLKSLRRCALFTSCSTSPLRSKRDYAIGWKSFSPKLRSGSELSATELGHRETHDLDLFTLEDVMSAGTAAALEAAKELGGTLEAIQTAPAFRRFLCRRGLESIVIDLVRDYVPQVAPEKLVIGGIRVDPPREILANKLCALLSRSEIRDLVDVRALELAGYQLEDALKGAATKDRGLTPAQLGWVLSQIELGSDLIPPGDVALDDLRRYLANLIARLTQQAYPKP